MENNDIRTKYRKVFLNGNKINQFNTPNSSDLAILIEQLEPRSSSSLTTSEVLWKDP